MIAGIIIIVTILLVMCGVIAGLKNTIEDLQSRLATQEDWISRIAGSEFTNKKDLLAQIEQNTREIEKVKYFAYRISTQAPEANDEGI